jgi:hypothetical protein
MDPGKRQVDRDSADIQPAAGKVQHFFGNDVEVSVHSEPSWSWARAAAYSTSGVAHNEPDSWSSVPP